MRPRPGLILGALVLSAAALGCSATTPSLQPSDLVSHGPTPTDLTSPMPTLASEPVSSPVTGCPGQPDLASIIALDPGQQLACFGRSELTFQATALATEVDCGSIQFAPAWLSCPPAAFLTPPGSAASWPGSDPVVWSHRSTLPDNSLMIAFSGNLPMLEVYAAPGSGVNRAQFVSAAIVLVSGHFDDPAAAACRIVAQREPELHVPTAAEVVLGCRERFVVTSVRPGSA